MLQRLQQLDRKLFILINQKLQYQWGDRLFPLLTHLGSATFSIFFLLVSILFIQSPANRWAWDALIAVAVSHLFMRFIKWRVPRVRPYITLPGSRTFRNPLADCSFPSGHTTAAFAMAITAFLYAPITGWFLLPLATLVGVSRIYLGLHYPSDVLAGALNGAITAILIFYLFH
ncbi:phosphatase PAP2 family protein [Rubeoparvulum massiliense]|uniref:phosphatase PAP2 family protein n=1 Tax=Rubeoparvulum massiliense TaxID=1631346 RepID=UPI00065DE287|nr:phosphatase PAP2 family protein [Rubeoparvulum massiliense]